MTKAKTNKELAKELGVTSRQISKSRKRGWLWKDGKKLKYTAPAAGRPIRNIARRDIARAFVHYADMANRYIGGK